MEVCASCGHPLGVGRFCTNCGHRVGEEPAQAGPPTLPPSAVEPPPQARYPLFADDVPERAPASAPASRPPPALPPPPTPAPQPVVPTRPQPPGRTHRSGGGWLPWAVGTVALLLFALIGALLLLDDDDSDGARDEATGDRTTESSRAKPDRRRSPNPSDEPPAGKGPLDVAQYAGVSVPDTAPPNVDVSGNPVRYEARNMVDEAPHTCWRMPGSGEDDEIIFTFLEPVEITEVGIVNGYAKSSGDLDWYAGNRRVLQVEWVFDDGTSVEQSLETTRDLQRLTLDAVTTTTITLRLLDVSEPGGGRSARNYTAISEVSLVGEPA